MSWLAPLPIRPSRECQSMHPLVSGMVLTQLSCPLAHAAPAEHLHGWWSGRGGPATAGLLVTPEVNPYNACLQYHSQRCPDCNSECFVAWVAWGQVAGSGVCDPVLSSTACCNRTPRGGLGELRIVSSCSLVLFASCFCICFVSGPLGCSWLRTAIVDLGS